jgi:uncharacterized protein (TIGR02145 family)
MLYAGDTVIRLEYETGIGEGALAVGNTLKVWQNYPNPFRSATSVNVYLPESGEVNLALSDASGRTFTALSRNILNGLHRFSISCGSPGIFILNVITGDEIRSIRLISEAESTGENFAISYQGSVAKGEESLKSITHNRNFPFTPGDIMQFFGYAGKDIDTIQDIPTFSTDYEFVFQNGGFPCPGLETIEYAGQTYNTIQVGNQCWFGENLNVGEFLSSNFMMTNNEVIEKHCYLDLTDYCDIYGGLYEWNELMDYSSEPGSQGICPDGWHLPDDDEWFLMVNFLGGDRNAGGLLKKEGTVHWDPPNSGATNQSGFAALPAGQHEGTGVYTGLGALTFFWSSTSSGLLFSNYWELQYNSTNVVTEGFVRTRGLSARCLRDM